MHLSWIASLRLTLIAVLLAACAPAAADMAAAHAAWRDSRHAEAFGLFRRYARLGSPTARYNVAMALLEGRVHARDVAEGHSWLDLAAAQGDAPSAARRDRVIASLSPADAAGARERAAALRARYGPAALANRLVPVPRTDVQPPARFASRQSHLNAVIERSFPRSCAGGMVFEFSIDALGHVRDVLAAPYRHSTADDLSCVQQRLPKAAARVQQLRFEGDDGAIPEGDAFYFQLELVAIDRDRRMRMILPHGDLALARDGNVHAQFGLALQLLFGVSVQRDEEKARRWLQLALAEGSTRVHYVVGIRALQRGDEAAALAAFRKGDEAGDVPSRRRLAWLAATTPDAVLRSPALAVEVSARIALGALDIEAHDIRAAALASAGRHGEAAEILRAALANMDFGGDYDAIRARMAAYRRGEAFIETENAWRVVAPAESSRQPPTIGSISTTSLPSCTRRVKSPR